MLKLTSRVAMLGLLTAAGAGCTSQPTRDDSPLASFSPNTGRNGVLKLQGGEYTRNIRPIIVDQITIGGRTYIAQPLPAGYTLKSEKTVFDPRVLGNAYFVGNREISQREGETLTVRPLGKEVYGMVNLTADPAQGIDMNRGNRLQISGMVYDENTPSQSTAPSQGGLVSTLTLGDGTDKFSRLRVQGDEYLGLRMNVQIPSALPYVLVAKDGSKVNLTATESWTADGKRQFSGARVLEGTAYGLFPLELTPLVSPAATMPAGQDPVSGIRIIPVIKYSATQPSEDED